MSDLRQVLKNRGWRQGMILDPQNEILEHEEAIGCIVLNQTCDCISPDLENEPYFEVLPFSRLLATPDAQLINGRNARRIHFQLTEHDSVIWVSARMADVTLIARAKHQKLTFSEGLSMSSPTLAGLISWRASRYLRPAFPDKFEKALEKPMKKIGKILKAHEDLIQSILIGLDPREELNDGELYEVQLRLMVTPELFAHSEKVGKLSSLAQKITEHLDAAIEFDAPKCIVQSLAEMSLFERNNFLDFNRYDYLSFGQDETSSDPP